MEGWCLGNIKVRVRTLIFEEHLETWKSTETAGEGPYDRTGKLKYERGEARRQGMLLFLQP